MNRAAMNVLITTARDLDSPMATIIRAATRTISGVTFVDPAIVRQGLGEGGYVGESVPALNGKHRRVSISTKAGVLVALGQAENEDEAILAAMLGYARESRGAGRDWQAVQEERTGADRQRQAVETQRVYDDGLAKARASGAAPRPHM